MRRIALAVLLAGPVLACIHVPRQYAGSVEQTGQEAILFWHDGRQQMILKNDFRFAPGPDGQLPDRLAWVVPVPAAPDHYGVEDAAAFASLFEAWERSRDDQKRKDHGDARGGIEADGLELLDKVSVGEYAIQPIRATGAAGARALDGWLVDNGFTAVGDRAAWYVERGWVWLAVEVRLARGSDQLLRQGSLRPLRISFATDAIVYPLLFSAGQGVFDVNLWVVTADDDLDLPAQAARFGFEVEGSVRLDLPAPVQAIQEKAAREGDWTVLERPVVRKLVGRRLGGPGKRLVDWKEDFRIVP